MPAVDEANAVCLDRVRLKARRAPEGPASASIYLSRPDGGELPPFKPGQWLEVTMPSGESRRYFLSSFARRPKAYRITVLRQPGSTGMSNFLLDELTPGTELVVRGPQGAGLAEIGRRPLCVASRGIGSVVVATIAEALAQTADRAPARFFLGDRADADLLLGAKLRSLRAEMRDAQFTMFSDKPHTGAKTFAQAMPIGDYDYVLCGAAAFVEPLAKALQDRQVAESQLKVLSFGELAEEYDWAERSTLEDIDLTPRQVVFTRSGVGAIWSAEIGTLLDLAIANGITLPFSCRTGMCGTCAQTLRSGRVAKVRKTSAVTREGQILLCSSVPVSDVEIEI